MSEEHFAWSWISDFLSHCLLPLHCGNTLERQRNTIREWVRRNGQEMGFGDTCYKLSYYISVIWGSCTHCKSRMPLDIVSLAPSMGSNKVLQQPQNKLGSRSFQPQRLQPTFNFLFQEPQHISTSAFEATSLWTALFATVKTFLPIWSTTWKPQP